MNKYQRLVCIVALLDLLLMVLFPPFNNIPLARGALNSFDGFYPLLTQLGRKPIHQELLTLQLMFVAANALSAWLLLQQQEAHEIPRFRYSRAIGLFTLVNLALICLFPPFEPYPSLLRQAATSGFDSFYFILGDRSRRPIFTPLLYLEVVLVVINALALWLLFNVVQRNEDATRRKIIELAESLDDEALQALGEEMRQKVLAHKAAPTLGRGDDRRQAEQGHEGPERRQGDRRQETE